MSITEILLLIVGAVIFAAGFIVPEMHKDKSGAVDSREAEEHLKKVADEIVEDARKRINQLVTNACELAEDDAARSMEKLSNEKIMAVNEYGKTVVDEIERNHKEVLFLYDMLNEKSADIKNTVRKVDSVSRERRENTGDQEKTDIKTVPLPAAKDRPALKAAIAGGVGRNTTAAAARHEKAVKEERRAAYGVISPIKKQENDPENKERGFKIPRMFAPGGSGEGTEKVKAERSYTGTALNDRIMELHTMGLSDVDIAKELGMGVGEIRLKIGLMEAKQE